MKKIIVCSATLFFLLSLTLDALAQSDASIKRKPTFKNQVDLDIYYLGIEGAYKKFIGIGLGGLMYKPAIQSNLKLIDGITEFVRVRPFIDFILNTYVHFETGLAIAPFAYILVNDFYGSSIGLELGVFFKVWKLEIGLRPALTSYQKNTKGDFSSPKLTTTLLIIKIPLSRW